MGIGNDVHRNELINIAGDPQSVIQIENFNASEFDRFENLFAVQACRGKQKSIFYSFITLNILLVAIAMHTTCSFRFHST